MQRLHDLGDEEKTIPLWRQVSLLFVDKSGYMIIGSVTIVSWLNLLDKPIVI